MAVCNECLRAWPVPAELHLELEKEARIAFFCKSRVNDRYRAVAGIANDVKHLSVTMHGSYSIPHGHVGRQSRDVEKVREFGESTARSGVVRRARYS